MFPKPDDRNLVPGPHPLLKVLSPTLLEELRGRHRRPVTASRPSPLRTHYTRLVDTLQLSDLMAEIHQQLPLLFQLFSCDFALLSRYEGGRATGGVGGRSIARL